MSNGTVFSKIAHRYDLLNTIMSLGQEQKWRRSAIDRLPQGRILDLGAGTGAANAVFVDREVVALDPAPEMLARNDATSRIVGVGEALPFADATFDAVFSAYVFRNLSSVQRTLEEIARVLRPQGKAGIVDLGRPPGNVRAALHRVGTRVILPTLGATVGAVDEYMWLHRSLDRHPAPEELLTIGPMEIEATWRMGPLGFVWGAILSPV